MKNKKIRVMILSVIALILVTLGLTYAYWTFTKSQTDPNAVGAACLDISITNEGSAIQLANQFPITDEAGLESSPYTFTVKNNCNTSIDYQISLEAIGTESTSLKTSSMKVALNDTVTLLSNNAEVDTTVSGAYEARNLAIETLSAKGTASYELRIWIDEDAPVSEQNKTFTSKISVSAGEGIKKQITVAEGTLAYDILSNYGGESVIAKIDNTKYEEVTSDSFKSSYSTSRYAYWGTSYKLDENTGNYTLEGTIIRAKISDCQSGTKTCGKYTFILDESNAKKDYIYEVVDFSTVTVVSKKYRNAFSNVNTITTGIYKTEDDLGTSYYFRGNVGNNYVKFGTWNETSSDGVMGCVAEGIEASCVGGPFETLEECEASGNYSWCNDKKYANIGDPMYWRIVRINGDGTIRLIYDGTQLYQNNEAHKGTINESTGFNEETMYAGSWIDTKYLGYTYDDGTGVQVNSTVKSKVDAWYNTNLKSEYNDYIADEIFCNDRTLAITDGDNFYAAYKRIEVDENPSLKCTNKADRYTVEDTTNGNGLLSYPVGLITADETVFAGAIYGTSNANYYLYGGSYSSPTTMTPHKEYRYSTNNQLAVYQLRNDGMLSSGFGGSLRPVINLKADVEFTGSGTIDDPYVVVTD